MTIGELPKRFATINGQKMAYVDTQPSAPDGTPTIWLQHGNPTSSYLWRDVIAGLAPHARCIAPDLLGMGDSDKLPQSDETSYRFDQHFQYLSGLLEHIAPTGPLILVLHDWGSGLGFHWAQRNMHRAAAVAYMEAITQPLTWEDWPENAREIFKAMRSPAGDVLVLEKNVFVERILPGSVVRDLTPAEMAVYRRPYLLRGEDRRPTLSWPREIPIEGKPQKMVELVEAYGQFMRNAEMPKLFINAEPGSILIGAARDFCRTWQNQEEVTVPGSHFIQEDSGADIGRILHLWLTEKGLLQP